MGLLIPFRDGRGDNTDFELFRPAPAPEGGFATESPLISGYSWSSGVYLQHEKDPVVFTDRSRTRLVDRGVYFRTQVHQIFSFNLKDACRISVDIPLTVLADHKFGGKIQPHLNYLNDITFRFMVPLFQAGAFHLGTSGFLTVIYGDVDRFGGSDQAFSQPGLFLLGEMAWARVYLRANLGYWERDRTRLAEYSLLLDDRLLYRLGGGMEWGRGFLVSLEYAGSSQVDDLFADAQHDAQELYLGLQKRAGSFLFGPALAAGLTKAFGVPSWRAVFSFFYIAE